MLARDIEALLAPQRRFEEMRERALRGAGAHLADLSYANAYGGPPREVLDALRHALDDLGELDLQYTPYGGATLTRRVVAHELSKIVGARFTFRDVVMTPGAMAALSIVFRALREDDPRGEVIVPLPCWIDSPLYLANVGLAARFVPVDPRTLRLDLSAIAAAASERTAALLLMQPVNPSGVMHTEDELAALADLLASMPRAPLLVSDESHRDVRFDDRPFVSPAKFWSRTCIVHSFGKGLRMQGQRIGYAAVNPAMPEREELARTLVELCRVMGFCTPTALMQRALCDLAACTLDWSGLAERRSVALDALVRGGYDVVPSDATYFLYPRTPGGDDWRHAEELADRGVLVLPAPVMHHAGHFRISLTCTDAMLERAAGVLARGGRR